MSRIFFSFSPTPFIWSNSTDKQKKMPCKHSKDKVTFVRNQPQAIAHDLAIHHPNSCNHYDHFPHHQSIIGRKVWPKNWFRSRHSNPHLHTRIHQFAFHQRPLQVLDLISALAATSLDSLICSSLCNVRNRCNKYQLAGNVIVLIK